MPRAFIGQDHQRSEKSFLEKFDLVGSLLNQPTWFSYEESPQVWGLSSYENQENLKIIR